MDVILDQPEDVTILQGYGDAIQCTGEAGTRVVTETHLKKANKFTQGKQTLISVACSDTRLRSIFIPGNMANGIVLEAIIDNV